MDEQSCKGPKGQTIGHGFAMTTAASEVICYSCTKSDTFGGTVRTSSSMGGRKYKSLELLSGAPSTTTRRPTPTRNDAISKDQSHPNREMIRAGHSRIARDALTAHHLQAGKKRSKRRKQSTSATTETTSTAASCPPPAPQATDGISRRAPQERRC